MKYLTRIEVNIRTYITYHVSNLYKTKPYWFISHSVMKPSYVNSFYTTVYGTKKLKKSWKKFLDLKHFNMIIV